MNEVVTLEVSERVAYITLNQPQTMNALSDELVEHFRCSISKVKSDSNIRSLILTGSEKAFSAGGDIKSFPQTNQ